MRQCNGQRAGAVLGSLACMQMQAMKDVSEGACKVRQAEDVAAWHDVPSSHDVE